MKIAVTSQNFRTVTGHAGRARRFIVFEVPPGGEPVEVERLDLPKDLAMHDFRGAGPHPLDAVDVVVSEGFGEGFAARMAKRGITVVKTDKIDPVEAVNAVLADLTSGNDVLSQATCGCGGGHGDGHEHRHGHRHGHQHHHAHGTAAGRGERHALRVAAVAEEDQRNE